MEEIKSFTLSEVLITLVVIGVIAAITVPVVMANHRKTETAARVKKFYSMMSNAIKLSELESGLKTYEWDYEDATTYEIRKQYFENHILNYVNYMNFSQLDDDYITELEATPNYSGGGCLIDSNDIQVYLNDGTKFGTCEEIDIIFFDVNGDKGPNKFGRDVFLFNILSYDGGLPSLANNVPHFNTIATWPEYWKENSTLKDEYTREKCIENCMSRPSGSYCTHLLELDGWEFKEDYPLRI